MGIIVQKFGGSSVADKEKLYNVANIITKSYDEGNKVVVVVSAQGKTTDGLVSKAKEITDNPFKREYDVLLSTGEQITISLLAMVLNKMGKKAVSFTGWQLPIITDNNYSNAKIKYIDKSRILEKLNEDYIVIIAGFQGIDENENITTLGRGGSDTTAVALAATLEADRCEIYTDVDGVFLTDPKIIKDVKKLDEISYEEMLELATAGAKVLHNRCVEIGKKRDVDIIVKSSLEEGTGGTVVKHQDNLEDMYISGIAKDNNIARITIIGVENKLGRTYKIFDLLAKENINIDIIVQPIGEHFEKDISFTISKENLKKTLEVLKKNIDIIGAKDVRYREDLCKISVVGVGMINNPGIAAKIFEALYENNINMHMITTSEIKISVLVNFEDADIAVKSIHDKFFL
ncbi:MAG: aspartate kinase [Clostridiales bacterium]|nr:aspartate kinase [Clostridiales bacterium]